jgi:formyltetrahydrofolate-dependent phosphoribosylglycinamide formyltransferase
MNKKIRLGILLSGGGRTMVNIADCIERGELPAEIVCVVSSRSAVAGVDRTRELGIEPHIVRRKDFEDVAAFSQAIAGHLAAARVDLVLQCGWLCLWEIPSEFENRVMNIHPALLPKFGGKGMWGHHVHEAVVAAGETESGCTVHFVNNQYDDGPILLQRTCPVLPTDDADSVANRVFEQECLAYPQAIRDFAESRPFPEI